MNQDQNQDELNQQKQLLKQVEALEVTVKAHLSREAITRYGTLKSAHIDKAMQALMVLAQLIQAKQITKKLSDAEFKAILMQLQQPKQKTKINMR